MPPSHRRSREARAPVIPIVRAVGCHRHDEMRRRRRVGSSSWSSMAPSPSVSPPLTSAPASLIPLVLICPFCCPSRFYRPSCRRRMTTGKRRKERVELPPGRPREAPVQRRRALRIRHLGRGGVVVDGRRREGRGDAFGGRRPRPSHRGGSSRSQGRGDGINRATCRRRGGGGGLSSRDLRRRRIRRRRRGGRRAMIASLVLAPAFGTRRTTMMMMVVVVMLALIGTRGRRRRRPPATGCPRGRGRGNGTAPPDDRGRGHGRGRAPGTAARRPPPNPWCRTPRAPSRRRPRRSPSPLRTPPPYPPKVW